MAIEWQESLATGIDVIDNQHKELFKRMHHLDRSLTDENLTSLIEETLDFLVVYVELHFADEEKVMAEGDYPEYQLHKYEHARFLDEVHKLTNHLEPDAKYARYILHSVILEWVNNHILKVDKKMALWLRTSKP